MPINFVKKYLPGNYWITKSMEFSKIRTSGTLWYLKKFITYYYWVFLRELVDESAHNQMFNDIMEFVNDLHDNQRQDAINLFFGTENQSWEFYNNENSTFKTYEQFIDTINVNQIYEAKKFYFAYLMGFGGQQGYKQKMKNLLLSNNYANYIDYKNKALQIIQNYRFGRGEDVRESDYSDFHASLRNERKIFFYYGFIHGDENRDVEGFHRLTTVGEIILKGNFDEVLLIWEHQKINMTSQSPITDTNFLNELSTLPRNILNNKLENLDILYNPYYTLMSTIKVKKYIDSDMFMYITSRINNKTNIENYLNLIQNNYSELLDASKRKVNSFTRTSDKRTDDFHKELKKYMLGPVNYPLDKTYNEFAFLNIDYHIIDQTKFDIYYDELTKINTYNINKNSAKLNVFANGFIENYRAEVDNRTSNNHFRVKYTWYNHIINFDYYLLIRLMGSIYRTSNNIIEELTLDDVKNIKSKYNFIFNNQIPVIIDQTNEIVMRFLNSDEIEPNILNSEVEEVSVYEAEDIARDNLISEIERISTSIASTPSVNRNTVLINKMRSLYTRFFLTNEEYVCECCGETTFLNNNDVYYMEFHHMIPFRKDNGPDHHLNIYGICSNCHSKFHHIKREQVGDLYNLLDSNNNLKVSIFNRLTLLKQDNILLPIHLQFLLAEDAITVDQYTNLFN